MKVALIDTGIFQNEIKNIDNVIHYCLKNKCLVQQYQEPEESHGSECFKEILSNSGNSNPQILDLNILEKSGELKVENIIAAMEIAIKEHVDVINISLGITAFSQKLYDVCERAVMNNIVVVSAASHTNTISFPADFNNVICVKVNQNQSEKIRLVDYTTVSIPMRDFIISEKGTEFDFSSSSLACARFCGCLCEELGEMPLNDKFKILSHKYKITLYKEADSNNTVKNITIQEILQNKKAAVVIFPAISLKKEDREFLHKNVVAYYDHDKNNFYSFSNHTVTNDFDIILVINSSYNDLEIPVEIQQKYQGHKVYCLGNYLNVNGNIHLKKYDEFQASEFSVLNCPVIAIMSLCSGLNKWDIQLNLLRNLEKDGLVIGKITNNPLGTIYDANVFVFPKELKFPEIVYAINRFMYLYEVNQNIDAWLINIGGAVGQINSLNTYNFGKLADAYLSAANIDVVILCINPSIDISFLELQIAYLHRHGVEKVFIVLSHNDINAATADYQEGLQTYYIDDKKYLESLRNLRENTKMEIFAWDEVENGNLYKSVIDTLS
ncbi:hypothetical protein ADH76_04530 [Enterocloster clostridioformis]|nr:hypothetical protein A4V08_00075 [Lachnoclostridium sp. YL32]NDO28201.1 S8 family serine peptidase [Enterocloster clostridioformis]OXE70650.1 hypothetical protein ADH76_04530 [Enterocloster clostridioformis]QQR00799.1 S8 family serine peptidase [Enterocloster clostridioformis]